MKKFVIISSTLFASMALFSCSGNSDQHNQVDVESINLLEAELRETISSQDSLLTIMNAIGEDMTRLKEVEGIMNQPGFENQSPERKAQIASDIAAIQNELESRRVKLAELEKKYSATNKDNANLRQAIATLKNQIDDQEQTIVTLRGSLAEAKIQIETLNRNIDELNERVDSVSTEKENVETQLNNELNTVYYALGNKNELKEHKLIETGFLRKTKVLPEDFEMAYFTRADKRTLAEMPLMSKKAKIITNQPSDSYEIYENEKGMKVLKIINPEKFWAVSNFLVVQID